MKASGRDCIKVELRKRVELKPMRLITHAHTHRVCLGIYPMIHVACQCLCNYSRDEGRSSSSSRGGGLVRVKSFAPRISPRRRSSSSTDPGSVWLLDTKQPCKRGCAANIPTLAGFSVFTSIRRPLALALAAAVSDPVVLRRRRVGRQRLTFGFLRVVLRRKDKKREWHIFDLFSRSLFFLPELRYATKALCAAQRT